MSITLPKIYCATCEQELEVSEYDEDHWFVKLCSRCEEAMVEEIREQVEEDRYNDYQEPW